MRRADRLFRIVEYLKARRLAVTAEEIAAEVDVSVRTVYRDVADLGLSGVPIVGEVGVGYTLNRNYLLRPLMFDVEELDAVVLGAQMVESWGDRALAKAARRAVDKIATVLPEQLREEMLGTAMFSMPSKQKLPISIDFTSLRRAVRARNIVAFVYQREDGEQTQRRVRPLALAFFGPVWLLLGWCEMRKDFRNFRLDRMRELAVLQERFRDEKGRRLQDFIKQMEREKRSSG